MRGSARVSALGVLREELPGVDNGDLRYSERVHVIHHIEVGLFDVLFWTLLAVRVWALVDCVTRKSAAFPAAGKLTKPAWALLTALSLVVSYFFHYSLSLLPLAFLIVSLVYLADVRPAVREVSGGKRW